MIDATCVFADPPASTDRLNSDRKASVATRYAAAAGRGEKTSDALFYFSEIKKPLLKHSS